ncbi:MAG: hypothetical protein K8R87_10860 [Verrucomicrobia bacterium]|nr:hypothetical protein [Verrucomicrobiota bacterium]
MTAAFGLAAPLLHADTRIVVPGANVVVPGHVSFGIYDALPSDYDGDYYLYNKRYYYGGKYETGKFSYEGHDYDSRYYHDGKYVYGGHYDHSKKSKHHKDKK